MGNLFQTIILNSLNMTLVALLLMIILRALKNIQSPKIRYYSWLIVLLGFLIPVRFSFGYTLFHFSNASEAPTVTIGAGTTVIKAAETGLSWNTIKAILFVIWLLGASAFAAVSFVRFFRWKRTILRLLGVDGVDEVDNLVIESLLDCIDVVQWRVIVGDRSEQHKQQVGDR